MFLFSKKNKTRKKRIDIILRQHFNKRHLFDSDSDSSSDDISEVESQGFENGLNLNGIGSQVFRLYLCYICTQKHVFIILLFIFLNHEEMLP